MNTTQALLPCPFCGSQNIDPKGWASASSAGPACDDCGASAGSVSNRLADNIAAWNRRAALRESLGGEANPQGWAITWQGQFDWSTGQVFDSKDAAEEWIEYSGIPDHKAVPVYFGPTPRADEAVSEELVEPVAWASFKNGEIFRVGLTKGALGVDTPLYTTSNAVKSVSEDDVRIIRRFAANGHLCPPAICAAINRVTAAISPPSPGAAK